MDPAVYALLGVVASVLGMFVGRWAKRSSYVIIPFNDLVSWLLLVLVFAILLMPDLAPKYAIIDPYNLSHDAVLLGFFAMYIYGYTSETLTMEWVSSHNIFKLQQRILPVVYYWNDDNQLCWQPQKFSYVAKRQLFGIDCPLDFAVNSVSRRRYIEFQGKFLKLDAYCVDTSAMRIKEDTVRKFHINFKVLSLEFDPSPMNTYDEYDFYTEGKIASEYVQNYQRLKVENMNASADLRMATIMGSIDIVRSITSMTPDAVVMGRVLRDLDKRNGNTADGIERARKVGVEDDRTANAKKRQFEAHQGGDEDAD